jgi:pantoate--beta-alanine ligase
MGAIHAGHLSLVDRARAECATVAASIFVNPLQFGPNEDFERYPRAFKSDCAKLAERGVEFVYAPTVDAVYPPGFNRYVDVGEVASRYEGALRPGHFRGVATVVLKLINATGPDMVFFGQKDAQQCAVVQAMLRDFDVPTGMVVCDTVREPDGLALSSRNVYLSPEERLAAPSLHAALSAMCDAIEAGTSSRESVIATGRERIVLPAQEAYLDAVDSVSFAPLDPIVRPCVVIGSVQLGVTRIIDNIPLQARGQEVRF